MTDQTRKALAIQVVNLNAAAGVNTLTSGAVPAGKHWRITVVASVDVNNAPTTQTIFARFPGTIDVPLLHQVAGLAAGLWITRFCDILLPPGATLFADFAGCVAGDDIYLRFSYEEVDQFTQ